jgi:hypothetical protein
VSRREQGGTRREQGRSGREQRGRRRAVSGGAGRPDVGPRRVTWEMTIGDRVPVNRPQTRKAFAAVLPMAHERCDSSNSALKDLEEGLEYEGAGSALQF